MGYFNPNGIKQQADDIVNKGETFITDVPRNNNIKGSAQKLEYDLEKFSMLFEDVNRPSWINKLKDVSTFSAKSWGKEGFANKFLECVNLIAEAKRFNWDTYFAEHEDDSIINLDKTWTAVCAENKLGESLDRLIDCLKVIKNEPGFKLNAKTKYDIDILIKGLKQSKDASESTVRTFLSASWELVKSFIPYCDKVEKVQEVLKTFSDVYDEASLVVMKSTQDVRARFSVTFMSDINLLAQPEENNRRQQLLIECNDSQCHKN